MGKEIELVQEKGILRQFRMSFSEVYFLSFFFVVS